MMEISDIRNSNNHNRLVGKHYLLEDGPAQMIGVAEKDWITQFIWPAGTEVEVRHVRRTDFEKMCRTK